MKTKRPTPRRPQTNNVRSRLPAGQPLRWRTILVPIDLSENTGRLIRLAGHLASLHGSDLLLLHVVETFPADPFIGAEVLAADDARRSQSAARQLKDLAAGASMPGQRPVNWMVRRGKPYREILSLAEEMKADLIVLSSHGYTGVKRVYLGSTAERVVRHASCPVLVERHRSPSRKWAPEVI